MGHLKDHHARSGFLVLKNCSLYDSTEPTHKVDIEISDGVITGIVRSGPESGRPVIDARGRMVVPGYIDIHVQGAGGADILDGTEYALNTISKTLARLGITSFLTTTVFRPDDNGHLTLARNKTGSDLEGARLLGIHLEGPFINRLRKGGISPDCIGPPSLRKLDEILELTGPALRMMTIAPELENNLDLIAELGRHGVIPALGHTNATYEETLKGFEAGISHVTHIFNAMPSLHHRKPGPLLAVFESQNVSAQIISDGVHLDGRIVRFLYSLLGKKRCICISDGVQGMGLPDGKYVYNNREYESRGGVARYMDGTLIGTTMSVGEIASRFRKFTGCSFKTAIETVTLNPARLLGLDDKIGSVETGKNADLVLLDEDHSVWMTVVGGSVVYTKD